jgi:hypothetical protein
MEVSGQLYASAALPPVPIEQESGWIPEPVWRPEKGRITPVGNRTPAVQHLARRHADYKYEYTSRDKWVSRLIFNFVECCYLKC